MKLAAILLFTTVMLAFSKSPAPLPQAHSVDEVLAQMEKSNTAYPYIQAKIEVREYNAFAGIFKDTQTGKIWMSHTGNAPRQVKIEFDKPRKEMRWIDKGVYTQYFPNTKTGQTFSFNKDDQPEGECVLLGLCQSSTRIRQFWNIALSAPDIVNGVRATVLDLTPKPGTSRATNFKSIRLWLDPAKGFPIQTRITVPNGNYKNQLFTDVSTNKFSDSVFKLDVPKDADIQVLKNLQF